MGKYTLRLFGRTIFESENRSSSLANLKDENSFLFKTFGGVETSAGVRVSSEVALNFSAFFSCVKVLGETLAMIPIHVYRKTPDGREQITNHPASKLLSVKPNSITNIYKFKETMQARVAAWGNDYAMIIRNGFGDPVELIMVDHPTDVEPFIFENRKYYKVLGMSTPVPNENMMHIMGLGYDQVKGKSVLNMARDTIGGAIALQNYANALFKGGATKKMAVVSPTLLSDKAKNNIESGWQTRHSGPENMHRIAFMEAGLDFKEIGISPEDAQMLASREFGVEEMARYFRIPLHMVGSMKGSTYSNIEQQAREFIDYTMMPWFTNWESELNDKLFRENEKGQYFVKFNVNALLRGDQKSRMEFYAKGIQWGILNPNDVRRLEDMNPRDGGDDYLTPVNMFTGEQLDLMVEKLKGEINGN